MNRTSPRTTYSQSGVFLSGLIAGAAVGAAAALLAAPTTGVQLREQITRSTDRARRRVSSAGTRALDVARRTVQHGRETLTKHPLASLRFTDSASEDAHPH